MSRGPGEAKLRPPDVVMRLARMGAAHQTRLSFLRSMLRCAARDGWCFKRPRFDIDARGVGVAIYCVVIGPRTYSLVAFGHDLPAERRTDRVIAEAWDATAMTINWPGLQAPETMEAGWRRACLAVEDLDTAAALKRLAR